MSGIKVLYGVAIMVGLVACGPTERSTTQASADAINVAFSSASARDGLRGLQPVRIETFQIDPAKATLRGKAVKMACDLAGRGYSATFTTPTKVNMPNFGSNSAPAALRCQHRGKEITRTLRPVNFSQNQRNSKTSNMVTGLILLNPGLLVGGAATQVRTNQDGSDIFGYSEERRMERRLIKQYQADLAEFLPGAAPQTMDALVALAELPLSIRGFGPVKELNAKRAAKRRAELLAHLRTGGAPLAEAAE